jgi:hypothetical protein
MTTHNTVRNTFSVSCPVCNAAPGSKCTHAARRDAARELCAADVLGYIAAHADINWYSDFGMRADVITVSVNWHATMVRGVLSALVADGRIVCKHLVRGDVFEIAEQGDCPLGPNGEEAL